MTLLLAVAGCGNEESCVGSECPPEFERFDGEAVTTEPLPYILGMDVTIDVRYGAIETVEGFPGEVSVVFQPFNQRAPDEELEALEELESAFDYTFETDDNAFVVTTDRDEMADGVGADVTVRLPPQFEGALVVRSRGDGPVSAGGVVGTYVADASSLDLTTENGGECFIDARESIFSTWARCNGAITLLGVSDGLDVASSGLDGNVSVFLHSVAGPNAGGTITSEDGNIELGFPDGSDFSLQAELASTGFIKAELIDPEACLIATEDRTSRLFVCGSGGPHYVATAGTGGSGRSDISIYRTP